MEVQKTARQKVAALSARRRRSSLASAWKCPPQPLDSSALGALGTLEENETSINGVTPTLSCKTPGSTRTQSNPFLIRHTSYQPNQRGRRVSRVPRSWNSESLELPLRTQVGIKPERLLRRDSNAMLSSCRPAGNPTRNWCPSVCAQLRCCNEVLRGHARIVHDMTKTPVPL